MPLVDGSYTNWGYDDQMPQAWSADSSKWGLSNEYHQPVIVNYDRDRLYRLYFADVDTDIDFNPISPVVSVFGFTKYNMATMDATGYVDVNAHFAGAFAASNDELFGMWLLPQSYTGTGSDLALIHHTMDQALGGGAMEFRATVVNLDTGTVLASTAFPSFAAVGGSATNTSPFMRNSMVCNIGTSPTHWYVISRNNDAGANGGLDKFSVYEIESDGSSATLTQRLSFATISSGVAESMSSTNSWRSDSDGISYWTGHDINGTPELDYIKWHYPWASPTVSTSVYSFTGAARLSDLAYHLTDTASYVVATRNDFSVSPDRQYVEIFSFSTPTGTYTRLFETELGFTGGGVAPRFTAENCLIGSLGATDLSFSYRKGRDSIFIFSTVSSVEKLWVLCIDTGTLTDASTSRGSLFASIRDDINGVFYFADPGGAASFSSREIKSRISTMDDLCSGGGGGGGGGGEDSEAAIDGSMEITGTILAITVQPCPIVGQVNGKCLTGRSSWSAGIGQVLSGRDDVTLPCD